MKKTLVLGASPKAYRYSYTATQRLLVKGHEVVPLGISDGKIEGLSILKGQPKLEDIDTVTLYVRPDRQKEYYDYILSLNPNRIIFNPGTENPELVRLAEQHGIEVEIACTLVMLSVGSY
jgi:predicted CoA-binding protein